MSSEQAAPPPAANTSGRIWLWRFVIGGVVASLAGFLVNRYSTNPLLSPDDPPEKTYQKILDAYGGQEALDRWRCGVLIYDSTDDLPGEPHAEVRTTDTFWLPGRVRHERLAKSAEQVERTTIGSDGERDWFQIGDGRVDVRNPAQLGRRPYSSYLQFYHPLIILDAGKWLGVKGVEDRSDGGRDLVLFVDASRPEAAEVRVDLQTKLLREFRGLIKFDNEGSPGRCEFSDYRKTAGGPVPSRITFYVGDRQTREIRFVSVEFRDHIDSALFDPPNK